MCVCLGGGGGVMVVRKRGSGFGEIVMQKME